QRIAIIGLGYVGLPLAIGFVEAGLSVVGVDSYGPRVAELACGQSPITPITRSKDPDLGPVLSPARLIRQHLREGQLIVLQSTTFPGTTSGPFRAALEEGGLIAGRDFDLAFAPERVNPGDPASASKTVPRLVGAVTGPGTTRAAALLRNLNDN